MRKFDRFLQQVDDRSFQVVDGVPFPDVACCEAVLDALKELLGWFPFEPMLLASNILGLLADDHPGKCPIKYRDAIGLGLQEAVDIIDNALWLYDYYAGPVC